MRALQPSTDVPLPDTASSSALPEGHSLSSGDTKTAADGSESGLLDQLPLEWFGRIAEQLLEDGGPPTKLGKVRQLMQSNSLG